jgi:hypothetical protein
MVRVGGDGERRVPKTHPVENANVPHTFVGVGERIVKLAAPKRRDAYHISKLSK